MYVRYLDDVMALIIGLFSCSFFCLYQCSDFLPGEHQEAFGRMKDVMSPRKKLFTFPGV